MTSNKHFDEFPDRWKKPLYYDEKLVDIHNLIDEINILRGYARGQAIKMDELEDQVDLARAYEREMLAQYCESKGFNFSAVLIREAKLSN